MMSTELKAESPFQERSREAVRRFLQTVVVVDDQARFESTSISEVARQTAVEEQDDSEFDDPSDVSVPGVGSSVIAPEAQLVKELEKHDLNAEALISKFAESGLVCAVLKPANREILDAVLQGTVKAAERADALIVDWRILDKGEAEGKHALQVIHNIVSHDLSQGGRMRLILVYTGERGTYDIAKMIKTHLSDTLNIDLAIDEVKPVLYRESLRITVVPKEYSKDKDKVSVEELPRKVIDEFSAITSGLASNATLTALAKIRSKTHSIVSTMHKGLDAPYLSHRALLPAPADAEELLVALIGDEIRSLLEQDDISKEVDLTAVGDWMNEFHPIVNASIKFKVKKEGETVNKTVAISKQDIDEILSRGYVSFLTDPTEEFKGLTDSEDRKQIKNEFHNQVTGMFAVGRDKKQHETFDCEFAALTTLKSNYTKNYHSPMLTLGSLIGVELDNNNRAERKYWLCIQPPCDSVRLTGPTNFLLLPLNENRQIFDLVVPRKVGNDKEFLFLKMKKKIADCQIVRFTPDREVIRARDSEGKLVFLAADDTRYEWIADLKFDRSQASANDLAANFSRVGLNISEWLRLMAQAK